MVVTDHLAYPDLFLALAETEGRIGRTVNPTIRSSDEITRRVRESNAFITRVLAQPKLWLIGTEDDLPARQSRQYRLHPPGAAGRRRVRGARAVRPRAARRRGARGDRGREPLLDLAYNAAHTLCLAALRRAGYRSGNRYMVFQALPHTLGLGPEVWRVLAKAHNIHDRSR